MKDVSNRSFVLVIISIFMLCVLRHIMLPGLYMDEVNPDYFVARMLNHGISNFVALVPFVILPVLGALYHGLQHTYLGLPFYYFFGSTVVTLRLFHALFGIVIIYFAYQLIQKIITNRWLAFIAMLALATDIAFIAAFRTQCFIILGGEAWLFVSLYLLQTERVSEQAKPASIMMSGIFYGLAIYGYFVFLFFAPVMLMIAATASDKMSKIRLLYYWCLGVAIGLLTYVWGYLSIAIRLGGFNAMLQWVSQAIAAINPGASHLSLGKSLLYAFDMTRIALSNIGNELLMFNQYNVAITHCKIVIMVTTVILGLGLLLFKKNYQKNKTIILYCALPFCYIMVSSVFGNRLWMHHYSILTPFFYIILAITLQLLCDCFNNSKVKNAILLASLLLLLGFNCYQQQDFFKRLNETGGVGKYSDAIVTLSNEAIGYKEHALYVFPEWGFFMPFIFLTNNSVPYLVSITSQVNDTLTNKKGEVRLLFWLREDAQKYEKILQDAGAHHQELIPYYQRNGIPAFYMIKAT